MQWRKGICHCRLKSRWSESQQVEDILRSLVLGEGVDRFCWNELRKKSKEEIFSFLNVLAKLVCCFSFRLWMLLGLAVGKKMPRVQSYLIWQVAPLHGWLNIHPDVKFLFSKVLLQVECWKQAVDAFSVSIVKTEFWNLHSFILPFDLPPPPHPTQDTCASSADQSGQGTTQSRAQSRVCTSLIERYGSSCSKDPF